MCVIIYKPSAEGISEEIIRKCYAANSHGAGFAYLQDGQVTMKKGYFNVNDLINDIQNAPLGCEMIVHFRIATSGKRDAANTHPFVVSQSVKKTQLTQYTGKNAVLAHNGILKIRDQKDERSDTSVFTSYVVAHALDPRPLLDWAAEESHSRFAYMDKHGVHLSGTWTPHEGLMFSNMSWKWTEYGYVYDDYDYLPRYRGSATSTPGSITKVTTALSKNIQQRYGNTCAVCEASFVADELYKCEVCRDYACGKDLTYDLASGNYVCANCEPAYFKRNATAYLIPLIDAIADYMADFPVTKSEERSKFSVRDPENLCHTCDNLYISKCRMCGGKFCAQHSDIRKGQGVCFPCAAEYDTILKTINTDEHPLLTPADVKVLMEGVDHDYLD